jgi:hypothetical protein
MDLRELSIWCFTYTSAVDTPSWCVIAAKSFAQHAYGKTPCIYPRRSTYFVWSFTEDRQPPATREDALKLLALVSLGVVPQEPHDRHINVFMFNDVQELR